MVFNLYQMSISEYLQEAMRFDIEEGHGWNEAEPKKPWQLQRQQQILR
jgi:hypothetical protein